MLDRDLPTTTEEAALRLARLAAHVGAHGPVEKRAAGWYDRLTNYAKPVADAASRAWSDLGTASPLAQHSLGNAALGAGLGGLVGAGYGLTDRRRRGVLNSALTGAALGGLATGGVSALGGRSAGPGQAALPGLLEQFTAPDPAAPARERGMADNAARQEMAGGAAQIPAMFWGSLPGGAAPAPSPDPDVEHWQGLPAASKAIEMVGNTFAGGPPGVVGPGLIGLGTLGGAGGAAALAGDMRGRGEAYTKAFRRDAFPTRMADPKWTGYQAKFDESGALGRAVLGEEGAFGRRVERAFHARATPAGGGAKTWANPELRAALQPHLGGYLPGGGRRLAGALGRGLGPLAAGVTGQYLVDQVAPAIADLYYGYGK